MNARSSAARGVAFLLVLASLAWLTARMYTGGFADTVPLAVETDRAGLTMAKGSPVKVRGVNVGTVADVRRRGEEVRLALAIDRDKLHIIPAGTTARLVPPTAFGNKYVELSAADRGSAVIAAGAVIPTKQVTVEVNEAFSRLTRVLDAAEPTKVNRAVTALADALDTRGEDLGTLVDQLDTYLGSLNEDLDVLETDVQRADEVVAIYRRALPDLVDVGRFSTANSVTLARRQAELHDLLMTLDGVSSRTEDVVKGNSDGLLETLDLLRPVTGTTARYAPEIPCLLGGIVEMNRLAEGAVGTDLPGIVSYTRLQPGDRGYRYPENLPVVGDDRGPACYGLPLTDDQDAAAKHPAFRTGANPYAGPEPAPTEDLATTLFGTLAGLVKTP